MLYDLRHLSTSTGSPALKYKPTFWPPLPSPHNLRPSEPLIVDKNHVAHHAVLFASTEHVYREPCTA